jgi:aspartate aminotransferase
MKIASRISKIEASKTLQVKEKALIMKGEGLDVVDLTAGEPDFNTPTYICQAGIDAINSGFTKYTANTGIPELRKIISVKLKIDNKLEYSPDQIIVSNGAKQAILNALLALVDDGDQVILPSPYWVSYPEQIKIAGGKPLIIDTSKNEFKINPELLKRHVTDQTRVIILNSPGNPTGVVYTSKEIEAIATFLENCDIWIISDEIYEKIIFDGLIHTSIASFGSLLEKTIVINGFSKSYSMTGWRIGYAAGPLEVVKSMSKIQSHYTSNASSISQKAALTALKEKSDDIEKMRKIFEERRNYLRSKLDSRPYFSYVNPQGAFYFFINISSAFGCKDGDQIIDNSIKFSTYVTEKYRVVTVPGAAFGADQYIRFSFAASDEDLEKGIQRLIEAMDNMLELKK